MTSPLSITVITGSRADYGILRSTLQLVRQDPAFRLQLIVTGAHLLASRGETWREIADDGIPIAARVASLSDDTPTGIATAMAETTRALAGIFGQHRPDWCLLTGDRFEMFAAASGALPFGIPMAHLHGGERSEGAFDESLRHAITKLSHLHFVSHESAARRVIQLGEEPWRVTVCGAPALDGLASPSLSRRELERELGLPADAPFLLVSCHPETVGHHASKDTVFTSLSDALARRPEWIVVTGTNADPGANRLDTLARRLGDRPRCRFATSLGQKRFFSALRYASALVGNSSSGILEAASFGLPVVNIGRRQRGRFQGPNVLSVDATPEAIAAALDTVLAPAFRPAVSSLPNPYWKGGAAGRIAATLRGTPRDDRLMLKVFHDVDY